MILVFAHTKKVIQQRKVGLFSVLKYANVGTVLD